MDGKGYIQSFFGSHSYWAVCEVAGRNAPLLQPRRLKCPSATHA
jgi:hypothetical protein